MPSINNINSNFRQIAIADASDNVTGITLSGASALKVAGGTSGQVLASDGTGGFAWTSPAVYAPWITTPSIIGAVYTAPTKPTMVRDQLRYRKVGDKIYQLQLAYQVGATNGTAGNGMYLYTLPGGLQFDTTIQAVSINGNITTLQATGYTAKIAGSNGSMWQSGSWASLMAYAYDATRFYVATTGGIGGAAFGGIQNNVYFQVGAGVGDLNLNMEFTFTATV